MTATGVVAVLLGPDGRVIANAADFKLDTPGGYSLREAQQYRCLRALAIAVVDACASPMLRDAIDLYTAERIVAKLVNNGCKVHCIDVGGDS